jgi:hypothetical protein
VPGPEVAAWIWGPERGVADRADCLEPTARRHQRAARFEQRGGCPALAADHPAGVEHEACDAQVGPRCVERGELTIDPERLANTRQEALELRCVGAAEDAFAVGAHHCEGGEPLVR